MSNKLIIPNEETISRYNDLWKKQPKSYKVKIFQDENEIDIVKEGLFTENELRSFGEGDEEINVLLESGRIDAFFEAVNSFYHTRIIRIHDLSDNLVKEYKNRNDFKNIDLFIKDCKRTTNRYEYSFATKVFSFIDNKKYPILDSKAVTLLCYYLQGKAYQGKKSDWGDYNEYKNAYNLFRQTYKLDSQSITYKEIDVFLWTYGTLLERYWVQKLGVLKFEGVQYKV